MDLVFFQACVFCEDWLAPNQDIAIGGGSLENAILGIGSLQRSIWAYLWEDNNGSIIPIQFDKLLNRQTLFMQVEILL